MKHFLFPSLLIFSTLSALEDVASQLQELEEANYTTCRNGFMAIGAFVGVSSCVLLKAMYGAHTSENDFRQLIFADGVYSTRARYCQDKCYNIQDEIRELRRSAGLPVYVENDPKLERIAWINSGKHFLYGVAFGTTLSATLKAIFEPEKVQPQDIIVPTALVTLSLIVAQMADAHVNAELLHIAERNNNL